MIWPNGASLSKSVMFLETFEVAGGTVFGGRNLNAEVGC